MKNEAILLSFKEIYSHFRIMPDLQTHMLRVAHVAEVILANWMGSQINKTEIISALLLHDLGNIVKFDLSKDEYWQKIQQETIERYGSSVDHVVTAKMLKEINVDDRLQALVAHMGFDNLSYVLGSNDIDLKICTYADLRVAPFGIVGIQERFSDLRKRYQGKPFESRYSLQNEEKALALEHEIFQYISLPPTQIIELKTPWYSPQH
jgi:HD domain-containing protein